MATSDETKKLQEQLATTQANAPGEYSSKYGTQIDSLMNQISNRSFSYDFNADPLYQQYKDKYTKLGKEASMNAVANASNMTGGYGNSYAATAGAQANQQYMTQLNNVIPELYQAALDKYNAETNQLQNQYSMYSDAENTAYNQYMDTVNRYNTDRDYYQSAYQNSVANDQWNENMQFEKDQAALSQENWQKNFDYQAAYDEQQQKNWQTQFDYGKEQDELAQSNWQKNFDYQKEQDALTQSNWQKQFDYQKEQDSISNAQWQAQFDENVRQFGLDYALQKAQVDLQKAKYDLEKEQNSTATNESNSSNNVDYSSVLDSIKNKSTGIKDSKARTTALSSDLKKAATTYGHDTFIDILDDLVGSRTITQAEANSFYANIYNGKLY